MPAQYEHIRDACVAKGKGYDEAQSIAAATHNKLHPGHPMSGHVAKHKAVLGKLKKDK